MDNVQYIESLSVLEIKEGDTVVVKLGYEASVDEANIITSVAKDWMRRKGITPDVLVLAHGQDVGVVRMGSKDVT